MISRLIDRLPKGTGRYLLRSLRSIVRKSLTYRFAGLFSIGLVSVLVLTLAFEPPVVVASVSGNVLTPLISQVNQVTPPKDSTMRVLETVGLFVGGIIFCVVLDRWFSNRSAQSGNTPLAEQARRLKQLKIGYQRG